MAQVLALADLAFSGCPSVVQTHGVFDVLHLGHVRYLRAAKKHGTVLVVTITADAFVTKGPGRPLFTAAQRAEMIAEIEIVDYVAIVESDSAVPAIEIIKPAVFVKGAEYAGTDLTGKMAAERAAVEAHGGRVEFTDEITFSSTRLINETVAMHDPEVTAYLKTARDDGMLVKALDAIEAMAGHRVAIVGELILDEYRYCEPLGKTGKENILAVRENEYEREVFNGGVAAVAQHLMGFGVLVNVVCQPGYPELRKIRYVDPSHMTKLFEVYAEDRIELHDEQVDELCAKIVKHAAESDCTIVFDYGHGLMTSVLISELRHPSKFLAVNAQTNGGNRGFNLVTKYDNPDFVCVSEAEARLAVGDRDIDAFHLTNMLHAEMNIRAGVVVTRGSKGCLLGGGDGKIPALAKTALDTMGAGDTFLAFTATLMSAGVPLRVAAFVGSAAAALKVGIAGHRKPVKKAALVQFVKGLLQ